MKFLQQWLEAMAKQQRVLDGKLSDQELLGELVGVPPEAFAYVLRQREIDVLEIKIDRWWKSIPVSRRPEYVTMATLRQAFGADGVGAWQIGNALRQLGWTSQRIWKENASRRRVWVPPACRDMSPD